VNKETKRTWLEEIRQLSNDSEISEDDLLFVDESVLASVPPRPVLEEKTLLGLAKKEEEEEGKPGEATLMLSLTQGMVAVARILKTIDVKGEWSSQSSNQQPSNSRIGSFLFLFKLELQGNAPAFGEPGVSELGSPI